MLYKNYSWHVYTNITTLCIGQQCFKKVHSPELEPGFDWVLVIFRHTCNFLPYLCGTYLQDSVICYVEDKLLQRVCILVFGIWGFFPEEWSRTLLHWSKTILKIKPSVKCFTHFSSSSINWTALDLVPLQGPLATWPFLIKEFSLKQVHKHPYFSRLQRI